MIPLLQNGFAPLPKFAGLSWAFNITATQDFSTLLSNLRTAMQFGTAWNQWVVYGNKYNGVPPRNGTKMPNAVFLGAYWDEPVTARWVFLFYIEPSDVYVTPPGWPKVADSNAT